MNEINELIHNYGEWIYLIAFFWAALEGETFVIFAGLAAQRGYLGMFELIVAVGLGSLVGDQICFWLGRWKGNHLLERFPKLKKGADVAIMWLERHVVGFILSYRFMYGVRNVSSIVLGMSHITWQKFALWNTIAAFVWAVAFANLGYAFGDLVEHIPEGEDKLATIVQQVTIAVVGVFALVLGSRILINYLQKRHTSKVVAEKSE
jgi:membrane protein DedA with SNARE-associated domain